MPGLQAPCFIPVIGRQRHSPNVSWLIKFDPAMKRVSRIDVRQPEPQHACPSSRRESRFSFQYLTQLRLRSTLHEG
jgi:hypothetical protein